MESVLFVLLDRFADWEVALLAPALRDGLMPGRPGRYTTLYAAPDGNPVRSIGGLCVTPDLPLGELPEGCAGVILAGGMAWQSPEAEPVAGMVREALKRGLLVGAVCNACAFLAAHGLLNGARHTGNALEQLRAWGGSRYTGEAHFEAQPAVRDGNLVTANGAGFIEFTRECLTRLAADTPETIAAHYAMYKRGSFL